MRSASLGLVVVFDACVAVGVGLLLLGGFYTIVGKWPAARWHPFLGLEFASRTTNRLTRAAPYFWKAGAALVVLGAVGDTLT